jgi:hypothetical protein
VALFVGGVLGGVAALPFKAGAALLLCNQCMVSD